MHNNNDEAEVSREDDDSSTDRREAISVALVPWKPMEVEVFRQGNRSSSSGTRSDETLEKLVIRELLAERREFYELMLEVRDFLRESTKSKTIAGAESNGKKASGPCGEEMPCSESPAGKTCNRRALFIRWYANGRMKKRTDEG